VIVPSSARHRRALDRDVLYPEEAHLGIRDLGIIGPWCTITSGLYGSTEAAAAVRELPGSSGRLSSRFPDD
jgi:hypothetical protein